MFKKRKEVKELTTEIRQLKKQLALSERERHVFQHLAERDFLTGAYNRHGFIRETERFLNEMKAEHRFKEKRRSSIVDNVAIIFVDVDNLKHVNDVLGHKKGDTYIKSIARALSDTVRDIDVVGRWGGDEFVVALINATEEEGLVVAQKMLHKVNRIKLGVKQGGFVCSASFGVISVNGAKHKQTRYDLHDLIEKADKAMYEAKTTRGKGSIVSFSGDNRVQ